MLNPPLGRWIFSIDLSMRKRFTLRSKVELGSRSRSESMTKSAQVSHSPSWINFHSLLHLAIWNKGKERTEPWQNQQSGMWAQRRLSSAWASIQSVHSSLSTWRKVWSSATHWAHSEGSDQTGRLWVFAGHVVNIMRWLRCFKSNEWLQLQSRRIPEKIAAIRIIILKTEQSGFTRVMQ